MGLPIHWLLISRIHLNISSAHVLIQIVRILVLTFRRMPKFDAKFILGNVFVPSKNISDCLLFCSFFISSKLLQTILAKLMKMVFHWHLFCFESSKLFKLKFNTNVPGFLYRKLFIARPNEHV